MELLRIFVTRAFLQRNQGTSIKEETGTKLLADGVGIRDRRLSVPFVLKAATKLPYLPRLPRAYLLTFVFINSLFFPHFV